MRAPDAPTATWCHVREEVPIRGGMRASALKFSSRPRHPPTARPVVSRLERENWNLYKRLEGVRPTIKIGAVPTVPKRAASAAEKRPVVRLPRPEWQD